VKRRLERSIAISGAVQSRDPPCDHGRRYRAPSSALSEISTRPGRSVLEAALDRIVRSCSIGRASIGGGRGEPSICYPSGSQFNLRLGLPVDVVALRAAWI
jgi:hypothetical protein